MNAAIDAVRGHLPAHQQQLASLVGIAGISADAFPASEVRRSADAVAETLIANGIANVRLLETSGHPAVYGEVMTPHDLPTILIYGHHDVQPPGREDRWIRRRSKRPSAMAGCTAAAPRTTKAASWPISPRSARARKLARCRAM